MADFDDIPYTFEDFAERGRADCGSELVAVRFRQVVQKRDKAVLLTLPDGAAQWFPWSQIEDFDSHERCMLIPRWLAASKELI